MYSKKPKPSQQSSFDQSPSTNQFVPRPVVIQPQVVAGKQPTEKQQENGILNASVFKHVPLPPTPRVQMKLSIGQVGDKYEQEADQVAANVVQQINTPQNQNIQLLSEEDSVTTSPQEATPSSLVTENLQRAEIIQCAKPADLAAAQTLVSSGFVNKKPPKLAAGQRAGGSNFGNYSKLLPTQDATGNPITYKEYDVNPYDGKQRDAERLVQGSDGRIWYTSDHYSSFSQI